MGNLTHAATRATLGKTIDIILKNANKDSDKEIGKLVDRMGKYMDGEDLGVDFDKLKEMVCNKDATLNKYINRVLDEVDPKVLKTMALNLGYEAFMYGTKTIRKNREYIIVMCHG